MKAVGEIGSHPLSKELQSNALCFGKKLEEMLSFEADNKCSLSSPQNLANKAREVSAQALDDVSSMFTVDSCKGETEFLVQLGSALHKLFYLKESQATDSAFGQLKLEEGLLVSKLASLQSGDIVMGLQQDDRKSTEHSMNQEIEVVYVSHKDCVIPSDRVDLSVRDEEPSGSSSTQERHSDEARDDICDNVTDQIASSEAAETSSNKMRDQDVKTSEILEAYEANAEQGEGVELTESDTLLLRLGQCESITEKESQTETNTSSPVSKSSHGDQSLINTCDSKSKAERYASQLVQRMRGRKQSQSDMA